MSFAGPSYQVDRPSRKCAATGRELLPGERFVATLVEVPGQNELLRLDYCQAAWGDGARPEPPMALFGSWKSVIEDENRAPRQLLDDEELLELFEQLEKTTEPRRIAFRFVLALVLIRKRLLVYEGGTPSDQKRGVEGSMLVRLRSDKDAQPTKVADPGMDDEAVNAATDQIGQIMNLDAAPSRRKGS